MVKPPRCSLLSRYGPSVVTTFPSRARATDVWGSSPAANTHSPAARISALIPPSACMIGPRISGGGGSPSGWYIASRYFVIVGSFPRRSGRRRHPLHERPTGDSTFRAISSRRRSSGAARSPAPVGPDELGRAVEGRQVTVAVVGVEHEEDAAEAHRHDLVDARRGDRPVAHEPEADGEVERLDHLARLARRRLHRSHRAIELVTAVEGDPPVAEVDHALGDDPRARTATDEHRRSTGLDRLRPAPDRPEVHELAVELRLVVGPDLLHRQHPLARDL